MADRPHGMRRPFTRTGRLIRRDLESRTRRRGRQPDEDFVDDDMVFGGPTADPEDQAGPVPAAGGTK